MSGGKSVVVGVLYSVGSRWAGRLIGMVSTVVLARILVPEDFGIVAMAFIVLGVASTLLDVGVNVSLVRNTAATPAHYGSAWTLRLVQAAVVALILILSAPYAGDYFHDSRVGPVMSWLSTNILLASFENIGIIDFQKNRRFDLEFRYILINRVFNFLGTVALALMLRNYWALVFAGTLANAFNVIHSYVAHPMRVRPSLERVREIFSVSQWMLVQNIGLYLDNNLHKILVGRRDDTASMGAYSLASELAVLPSTELLQPLNRVLFPAFVSIKHDLQQLKQAFLMTQAIQVMVAVPAAVFLSCLAPEVVYVLLGEKWGAAIPLLQALSIGAALGAIQVSAWYVSITLGQERPSAAVTWLQVMMFATVVVFMLPGVRAEGIAWLRAVIPAAGLLMQMWILRRALGNLKLVEVVSGLWRTFAAVGLVAWLLLNMPKPTPPFAGLLAGGAACLTLYPLILLLLWKLVGAPDGAERYLLEKVKVALPRSSSR